MTSEGRIQRMALRGDHFERTFRISDFSNDIGDRAAKVCALLNDCYPSGTHRDMIGATSQQMVFVLTLAGLKERETENFFNIITCAGGISSWQAHHLINKLKGQPFP